MSEVDLSPARARELFPNDPEIERIARKFATSDALPGPVLICLKNVESEGVSWLWRGRVPLGKLTVLDGDPGLGKTLITLDLAARVTCNLPMPDLGKSDLDAPAGVVILSAEDDPADTIRPRFDAAGGDPGRVVLLQAIREQGDEDESTRERSVTLADLAAIEGAIKEISAKLVIIDPVMAYLGSADAHRDSEIRNLLAPLSRLASQTGAAILLVRHLRKTATGNPLYAGGGSIGIVGAVRSGMIVCVDPDDKSGRKRILAMTKSNLSEMPVALVYEVLADNGVPRIAWSGTSEYDARMLLAAAGENDDERGERSTLNEAVQFLRDQLRRGAVAVKDLQAAARAECITPATLRRAKVTLGARAYKAEFSGGWLWSLPGFAEGAQSLPEGAQNRNEHLRAPSADSGYKRDLREEAQSGNVSSFGASDPPNRVEIDEDIPF